MIAVDHDPAVIPQAVERAPVEPSDAAALGRRRVALVGASSLVAALPVITDPSGWYVFVAMRWALLVLAIPALFVAVGPGRVRLPAGARWWACLLGVAAVSASLSGAPFTSWFGANDRLTGVVTWVAHGAMAVLGASVVRRRSHLRTLTRGVSTGAVLVAAFVAAQRMGWAFPAGVVTTGRPGGPLGNADFLGAYAALALLVAVGSAIDEREVDAWRLLHVVAALGSGFGLIVSGTRAGWLGVAAGLVAFAVLAARRAGVSSRQAVWVAVLCLVGLVGLGMWAGVGHRLGGVTSGTAAGRVATWERTATVIGERPVLGWGPEGFATGFGRAVDDGWERTYGRRLTPDRAHNGLLDVGATLGMVGLAAYLGVLVATGRAVRRSLADAASPAMVGVAAALVAYLVQQQFLFQLVDVDAIAWLLAGAVAGLSTAGSVAGTAPRRSTPRFLGVGLAAVAVVASVVVAVGGVAADRDARRSVDALRTDPAAAVTAARRAVDRQPQTLYALALADAALTEGSPSTLQEARARLAGVAASTGDDGRLTLARARLARADGVVATIEESIGEVGGLLAVDPSRAEAWLERGRLLAELGRDDEAVISLRRAVSLAPGRTDVWLALALAADRAGDATTAREAFDHLDPATLGPDALMVRARLLSGRPSAVLGR